MKMGDKDILSKCPKRRKLAHRCEDCLLQCPEKCFHGHDKEARRTNHNLARPIYRPITGDIRLLILMPKQRGLELAAELATAIIGRLGKAFIQGQGLVQYTALSYRWGTKEPERKIWISEVEVSIGKNLHDFLQLFRHSTEQRVLWIDALCINQSDQAERSLQVSRMHTIYENAKEVIVWLGEDTKNTQQAIEFMKEVSSQRMGGPYVDWSRNTAKEVILGAEDLYKREWIRRLWVIQEVWAAKEIIVWCGSSSLNWATFVGGARHAFDDGLDGQIYADVGVKFRPHIEPDFQYALQNLWESSLAQFSESVSSNQKSTLLDLLLRTTGSNFTNDYDRIYALLSMAQEGIDFEVDYDSALAVVFANFTRHLMKRSGIYTILALDANFGGTIHGHKLPSWSPDWRTVTAKEYFVGNQIDTDIHEFQFSKMICKLDSDSEDFRSLILRGRRLATVDGNASDSHPHYRVSWNGYDFETEQDNGPSTNSQGSRLLADVPVKSIKPVDNAKIPEHAPPGISQALQTGKLTGFAAPLIAQKGDLVVASQKNPFPIILRNVSGTNTDSAGEFAFIGCALPIRYSKHKEAQQRPRLSLCDRFEHLGTQNAHEIFTLI